jgi:tetratricopeptide (TPR) repeat protein
MPAHKEKSFFPSVGSIWLIILLGVTLYSFSLGAPFSALDDKFSIVDNPLVRNWNAIREIFTTPFFGAKHYYRPLVQLSYLCEYQAFGLNPFYYHLTNLLLHLACAFLVYRIARHFLREHWLSWSVVFLFALHPINAEAVVNISGRAILLSAFFILLAFCFFLRYIQSKSLSFLFMSYGAFIFGLLSKESSVMFLFVLLVYLWFFRKEKKDMRAWLGFVVILGVYLWIRYQLGITQTFRWWSFEGQVLGVISFLRGVFTWARLIIFPVDAYFDRSQEIFLSFRHWEVWGVVAVFVLLSAGLWFKRKQIPPLVLFCLFWMMLELFPVSQILSGIGVGPGYISLAEHFLYVACIPLFITIVYFFRNLLERFPARRRLFQIISLCFLGFFSLMTIEQSLYASHPIALLKRSLQYNPYNSRVLNSLGLELAHRGHIGESEVYFRRALEVDPHSALARISLGKALCDQGRCFEAMIEYEKVRDSGRFKELLKNNLKATYEVVIRQYQDRLQSDKNNPQVWFSLGVLYTKYQALDQSIECYDRALTIDPDFRNALFNLGSLYESLGKVEKSIEYFERFVASEAKEGKSHLDVQTRLENLRNRLARAHALE